MNKTIKNLLIGLTLFLLIAVSWQYYLLNKLSMEVSNKTTTELFVIQEKCAQQAEKIANNENHKVAASKLFRTYHSHSSHYNSKLNKCFALILTQSSDSEGYLSHSQTLLDAFSNRDYGLYIWTKKEAKGESFFGFNPVVCKVMPTLTAEKKCSSLDEFQLMIAPFLE